eukprot:CAMPEP_0172192202 /NCGR_PEP_ID=MMETSP1050-20130122/24184_1 /TAXON_ID=233186 /ORGANISM="Cryptomonas curvata, Strain CCAP979/52" /LENGTH=45 /DNA_ID= /DNA_START= /DNA_END= /DNA_ORIENTATION=
MSREQRMAGTGEIKVDREESAVCGAEDRVSPMQAAASTIDDGKHT